MLPEHSVTHLITKVIRFVQDLAASLSSAELPNFGSLKAVIERRKWRSLKRLHLSEVVFKGNTTSRALGGSQPINSPLIGGQLSLAKIMIC